VKKKTLHMIGNAHIDPAWLWQLPEGFQEVKSTFRDLQAGHQGQDPAPRWAREIEADFAPCEIKTFRVPRAENLPVIGTNLLECEEPEG
jgi:hypothetical protein